ncbi:MAG: peptidylprolyl isomerase [Planctomycetota bacterium]
MLRSLVLMIAFAGWGIFGDSPCSWGQGADSDKRTEVSAAAETTQATNAQGDTAEADVEKIDVEDIDVEALIAEEPDPQAAITGPDGETTLGEFMRENPEFAQGRRAYAKRFAELKDKLAEAIGKQRATFIRYRNRVDRSDQARARYLEERRDVEEAMERLFEVALDYQNFFGDADSNRYILRMVRHRLEHDIYDGKTLDAAVRMIRTGNDKLYLFIAAARSAVVEGKCENAKQLFDVLLKQEDVDDLDRGMAGGLPYLQEQYDEEIQRIRADEAADDLPRVRFETTAGDFVVELYLKDAPSTVSHFIGLVEDGFYKENDFFQVVSKVLALTGDPNGTGNGHCGKFLKDENVGDADARQAMRGSLVMAKYPKGEGEFEPHTASSQFAILFMPNPGLIQQQTVFGRVIEGMDVVSRLRRVDPSKEKKKDAIEVAPDRIKRATVIRRPDELPEPVYHRVLDAPTTSSD